MYSRSLYTDITTVLTCGPLSASDKLVICIESCSSVDADVKCNVCGKYCVVLVNRCLRKQHYRNYPDYPYKEPSSHYHCDCPCYVSLCSPHYIKYMKAIDERRESIFIMYTYLCIQSRDIANYFILNYLPVFTYPHVIDYHNKYDGKK